VSFSAPNYLITKAVLETHFDQELNPAPTEAQGMAQDQIAAPDGLADKKKAEFVSKEIDKYAILAGFLSGPWGLILPFVVEDQITDALTASDA